MLVLLAGDVPVTVVVAVPLHSLLYMVMCLFHFLYDAIRHRARFSPRSPLQRITTTPQSLLPHSAL